MKIKEKSIIKILILVFSLFSFNLEASNSSNVWNNAYKSVVVVLPTWSGYSKPGFGAPNGVAPAGTGFLYLIKK